MDSVVFGRNMIVGVKIGSDYVDVGCAYSCSFNVDNEIIGKTHVNSGLFRNKRKRLTDATGSVQGLATLDNAAKVSVMYFLQHSIAGTELDMRYRFVDESGLAKQIQGFFIVKSIAYTGDVSAFCEFDMQLENTGGFSLSSIIDESGGEAPGGESGLPGDVIFDWWDTTPGGTSITGTGNFGRSFAGHDVLFVSREGIEHEKGFGTPGNREYLYNLTSIAFDPGNSFNDGERIYVLWQIDQS